MTSISKKTKLELELLTDVNLIKMVEKEIRGGICQAVHWYPKVNNEYMKDYEKMLGCKKFIRMVNVSKVTRRQF